MSEIKHTQGTWKRQKEGELPDPEMRWVGGQHQDYLTVISDTGGIIAICYQTGFLPQEAEANAKLISDAPETLRKYTELLDKHSKALSEIEQLKMELEKTFNNGVKQFEQHKADKAELVETVGLALNMLGRPEDMDDEEGIATQEALDLINTMSNMIAKHKEK